MIKCTLKLFENRALVLMEAHKSGKGAFIVSARNPSGAILKESQFDNAEDAKICFYEFCKLVENL